MYNLITTILQLIVTLVAVMTMIWRFDTARQKRLDTLQEGINKKLEELQKEINKVEDKRREDMRISHNRVDMIEKDLVSSLNGRLARIEGELKGHTNILSIIQTHYVKKGSH